MCGHRLSPLVISPPSAPRYPGTKAAMSTGSIKDTMHRRPNLVCYSRPTVYAYVPNFVSIGLFCRPLSAKTPNFCRFWTSAFSVVATGSSLRKMNTGAQLQTFPYPTASKLFLYSNAFMAKSGAQSMTFKSVTNRQTNRQKLNVFGHPGTFLHL